ncbi:hypothetical protein SAMN06295888_1563 [Desulfonatronum zhilinae]|nr:hypothetical protein SAMN06295888_1563 [Desulfonatronum zhilinae]
MDWMNNPWIVGIGGGILSGLLVTFVSRALFSRRDRREYAQKLASANREVIYALRPGLSEGHVPDSRVVESLISATARKYAVEAKDMYGARQVGEELIKEIMDSSFISASTKQEYCNQLESLRPATARRDEQGELVVERTPTGRTELEQYRARMVSMTSAMMGIVTMLMTVMLVFSDFFKGSVFDSKPDSVTFLLPMVAALMATVMAAAFMMLRNDARRRMRDRDNRDKDNRDRDDADKAT